MKNRMVLASWLFILGSSLFVVDAVLEITTNVSPVALMHLTEGITFLVGSVCFMPSAQAEP
ncbi:MAG: hypothetical protein F6K11_28310 [Leptolyngbya sp. SIO3F4]|nr:hypothetical protein [Leptolyngbya sp. SIO3F4]